MIHLIFIRTVGQFILSVNIQYICWGVDGIDFGQPRLTKPTWFTCWARNLRPNSTHQIHKCPDLSWALMWYIENMTFSIDFLGLKIEPSAWATGLLACGCPCSPLYITGLLDDQLYVIHSLYKFFLSILSIPVFSNSWIECFFV